MALAPYLIETCLTTLSYEYLHALLHIIINDVSRLDAFLHGAMSPTIGFAFSLILGYEIGVKWAFAGPSHIFVDQPVHGLAISFGCWPHCLTDSGAMGLGSSARVGLGARASANNILLIGLLHFFGHTSA